MARHVTERDLAPLLAAAREWIDRCLVEDRSLLVDDRNLWTAENADRLQSGFVERPDSGSDDFMTQARAAALRHRVPQAQQLTAEMMWVLLLFPSNISADVKRVTRRSAFGHGRVSHCSPIHAMLDRRRAVRHRFGGHGIQQSPVEGDGLPDRPGALD